VSAASLCHVAWAQVLARVSGRQDVVFGTVLFGRMADAAGAARAVGMFINTLPIRIRLGGDSVAGVVHRTHALFTRLLRHEHAPLALAQRASGVAAPAPLFTALFNYRHSDEDPLASGGADRWPGMRLLGATEVTSYPFGLSVDDQGEGFELTALVQRPIDPRRICG
jgi:non-ribosomal peptide synthetase component F